MAAYRRQVSVDTRTLAERTRFAPKDDWSHGLFDCFDRGASPCCVLNACFCGGILAWSDIATKLQTPRAGDVLTAVVAGQVVAESGRIMNNSNPNGAGSLFALGGALYTVYARASGRVQLSRHLGHANPETISEACCKSCCCAACSAQQELDSMIQAYVETQKSAGRGPEVDVVYGCDGLPNGGPCCCRCCYLADKEDHAERRLQELRELPAKGSVMPAVFVGPVAATMRRK